MKMPAIVTLSFREKEAAIVRKLDLQVTTRPGMTSYFCRDLSGEPIATPGEMKGS